MSVTDFIILGLFAIGQLTALVIGHVKNQVKLKEFEMAIQNLQQQINVNRKSFHIHEQQNERMFNKFEEKQDDTLKAISELKTLIIEKM